MDKREILKSTQDIPPASNLLLWFWVFAVVIYFDAVGAGWLLFGALALSLLAIETARFRPCLALRGFIGAFPKPSMALIASWLCLVAG
jgi:hypothetical protein